MKKFDVDKDARNRDWLRKGSAMKSDLATKRQILAMRLGQEPQPPTLVVRFRAMKDVTGSGRLIYVVGGVAYASMQRMRDAYPEALFERIKATKKGRLFG